MHMSCMVFAAVVCIEAIAAPLSATTRSSILGVMPGPAFEVTLELTLPGTGIITGRAFGIDSAGVCETCESAEGAVRVCETCEGTVRTSCTAGEFVKAVWAPARPVFDGGGCGGNEDGNLVRVSRADGVVAVSLDIRTTRDRI